MRDPKSPRWLVALVALSPFAGCALIYDYGNYQAETTSSPGGGGSGATSGMGGSGAGGTSSSPAGGGGVAGGPACDEAVSVDLTSAVWAIAAAGDGVQGVNHVALADPGSAFGDVLIAGTSYGTFDLAGEEMTVPASGTPFAARIGAEGSVLWRYASLPGAVPSDCDGSANGIASDGEIGAFVVGNCKTGMAATDDLDGFLLHLGNMGLEQASHVVQEPDMASGDETLVGVVVDSNGVPTVLGRATSGGVQVGMTDLTGSGPDQDIVVLRCDSSACDSITGVFAGGVDKDQATALTTLPSAAGGDAVIIAGSYRNAWLNVTMPDPPVKDAVEGPTPAPFVARRGETGIDWARGFVGELGSVPKACGSTFGAPRTAAVAPDDEGNLVATGWTCYPTRFDDGGSPLPHGGQADVFVVKLNGATGETLWAKTFGDSAEQAATGVAVDRVTGHIFVSGIFAGQLDLGNGVALATTQPAKEAIFVAELDPDGCVLQARHFGEEQTVVFHPVRIAVDASSLVIGGVWGEKLDFGTGPLLAELDLDGYVARFARDR